MFVPEARRWKCEERLDLQYSFESLKELDKLLFVTRPYELFASFAFLRLSEPPKRTENHTKQQIHGHEGIDGGRRDEEDRSRYI